MISILIFGLIVHAHSSFGHDTEDIDAEDISNTFERSHLKNDRFQNAVADFQLDDTVGDEGLDDDFDNEEREAEMDEQRSDAKPWVRRIVRRVARGTRRVVRKVIRTGKKVIKKVKKIFRRRVCYRTYGCFQRFKMPWDLLPQSPRRVKTKFFLTTRKNRKGIRVYPLRLRISQFRNRKTIFIVHGWKGHYVREKWIRRYAALFLKRGNFNIFEVYWGGGARTNYFTAAGNARLVGAQIAYLTERLHTKYGLSFNNVHIIGHSLGAHIAGYAGRRLRSNKHPIARITGLDPAGPVFSRRNRKVRLDSTDAKFVDVLHTSFLYLLGIKGRAGHADFYINGGGAQPGCSKKNPPVCSHARVIDLFQNTILPQCSFKAYKCSSYLKFRFGYCRSCRKQSCVYMGYDVCKNARGKYYLKTKSSQPFCYVTT